MSNNPWKTLDTKEIYENAWISLREDSVTRPDGSPGIYGVVTAKSKAVGVIAIDEDDNLVMVGQYRYPTKMYSWEIVEGGSKPSEDSLETAKRELKEEAGVTAKSWELLVDNIQLSNCFLNEIGVVYVARDLEFGEANPDPDEALKVRKEKISKVKEMIKNGEITDALSLVGLHTYFFNEIYE